MKSGKMDLVTIVLFLVTGISVSATYGGATGGTDGRSFESASRLGTDDAAK
jgi:hypothetical protein